jgi:hypothetical protein
MTPLLADRADTAIREHALTERRRPALDERVCEVFEPVDVGERAIHAGERCAREVFGRRRRTHRDAPGAQTVVGVGDLLTEPVGNACFANQLLRPQRRRCQLGWVVDVDARHEVNEVGSDTTLCHRLEIGVGRHHETRGDRHSGARELAEIRALPPGAGCVVDTQIGEPGDRGHGHLLARRFSLPASDFGSAATRGQWSRLRAVVP